MIRALTLLIALFAALGPALAQTKSFPEAQGFGQYAKGGRGGAVYLVTNLNDAGKGSLRDCVQAVGPRTCVFMVGGTIELLSPLRVSAPQLTIAGQTAPGGGIALKLSSRSAAQATPLLIKNTRDVIVRHIRLRPGPSSNRAGTDALTVEDSSDVIIDHVSMSWAPDENFNAHRAVTNLTVQWSILSEGLMDHSKGSLTCSDGWGCGRITLHHNLYVSNRDRNPDIKSSTAGSLDFINNVVHNPRSAYVELWSMFGDTNQNIVGNVFLKGPATSSFARALKYDPVNSTGRLRVYQKDNVTEVPLLALGTDKVLVTAPAAPLSMTAESARAAYPRVLATAGAWPRDAVDARVANDVSIRSGRLIRDPSEVGGWPSLARGKALPDTDKDGMPDAWETQKGLNPKNASDRNKDRDKDGYTELEEYLNEKALKLVRAAPVR